MKKILLSSILFSTLVFSEQIRIIPIDKSLLAHENGGNKSAIDAYSDGVGIITESNQFIDNSPMNQLVFTYGEKAKNEGSTLKDYSLNNGDNKEKEQATKLGNIIESPKYVIGESCDDGNFETINDIYIDINGSCKGVNKKDIFELVFKEGQSIYGGTIDFNNNGIFGYRVYGSGEKGYHSITLDKLYNIGIKELNYTVKSNFCGSVYFGLIGNVEHNTNISYGKTMTFNLNLETKTLIVNGADPGYKTVIDNSHRDLSELVIGISAIQAVECLTYWTFF